MDYYGVSRGIIKIHTIETIIIINWQTLGDGNLTIEGNKQPRFRFQHRTEDYGWCLYCFEELREFVPLNSPKYIKNEDPRLKAGFSENFYVQSKTSIVLTLLKTLWYNGKKKVLPIEFLKLSLSEESLAWWYQDDGHLVWKDGTVKKIILSTDNFTIAENLGLIELLAELYNLRFSLDGKNRICLYDQPQIMYFLYLVKDYIHPVMARKLPTYCIIKNSDMFIKKRTSIYLPSRLTKPTEEIKKLLIDLDTNTFVNNWFINGFKIGTKTTQAKYSYQVTLTENELNKIQYIQRRTGLRMSEIVSELYLN